MSAALEAAVASFVEEMTPILLGVAESVKTPVDAERQATADALEIARTFIAADGRLLDEELTAFIKCFGPRMGGTLAGARNDELRNGYFDNASVLLQQPSRFFDVLITADRKKGTRNAWLYYQAALKVAYATIALDIVPSDIELKAMASYRSVMWGLLSEVKAEAGPTDTKPEGEAPVVEPSPAEAETIDEVMAELDGLVGLAGVKAEVKLVTDFLRVQQLRKAHNLPTVDQSRHLVFTGNPGTGKTTVARLIARIYKVLGAVDQGQLVETDRSGLVAGYIGQTATKVNDVFKTALGGVLLIDEAYALARGGDNDFGREAIDTLVKLIEDHRDDVVVIAAGYPQEMKDFIETNPGLRSRFPKTIHFDDYDTDDLVEIFQKLCEKSSYICDTRVRAALRDHLNSIPRDKGFGNARLVRNMFEAAIGRQASRIVASKDPSRRKLMTLTVGDVLGESANDA